MKPALGHEFYVFSCETRQPNAARTSDGAKVRIRIIPDVPNHEVVPLDLYTETLQYEADSTGPASQDQYGTPFGLDAFLATPSPAPSSDTDPDMPCMIDAI